MSLISPLSNLSRSFGTGGCACAPNFSTYGTIRTSPTPLRLSALASVSPARRIHLILISATVAPATCSSSLSWSSEPERGRFPKRFTAEQFRPKPTDGSSLRRCASPTAALGKSCNLLVLEFSRVVCPHNAIAQFPRGLAHPGFPQQLAASVLAAVADDVMLDRFCQSVPA